MAATEQETGATANAEAIVAPEPSKNGDERTPGPQRA